MGHIGSTRFRFSSDLVRVISDFGLNRVIMVLDRFGFGSGQFRISSRNRFNFFSCRFGSGFGSFGSGQLDRITFARSPFNGFVV